ncbi:hypothetical protein SUGI_0849710 [Cryptomeria japonica]|nr:hypothetical protein SUGI_0849710 [Cryptomeria japonica]
MASFLLILMVGFLLIPIQCSEEKKTNVSHELVESEYDSRSSSSGSSGGGGGGADALKRENRYLMHRRFGYNFNSLPKGIPFLHHSGPSRRHNGLGLDSTKSP